MYCPHCEKPIEILDLEIDYYGRFVKCGPKSATLTETQLFLFECLWDAYPHPVSTEELHETIYSDREPDKLPGLDVIHVTIERVRKELTASRFPITVARLKVDETNGYALAYRPKRAKTSAA